MGQDLRVILGHNLNLSTLKALPSNLDNELPIISKLMEDARIDKKNIYDKAWIDKWTWGGDLTKDSSFDDWLASDDVSLHGPGALFIDVGKHALIIGCWIRWKEFILNEIVQKAFRTIVLRFGKLFESNCAIYIPDSGSWLAEQALSKVYEGFAINEIVGLLLKEAGQPAKHIKLIYEEYEAIIDGMRYNCYKADGYFIEQFK